MKAILQRLRRVEVQLIPQTTAEDRRSTELAEQIRERRRRRLEEAGLPFEELPPVPADYLRPGMGIAERIRAVREYRRSTQHEPK